MKEDIRALLGLHVVDLRILDARKDLDAIPAEIESLQKSLSDTQTEAEQNAESIKSMTIARDKDELELKSISDETGKLNGQLVAVKTNEQYAALEREIEHLYGKSSDMEEKILLSMEALEHLDEERGTLEKELRRAEEALRTGRADCEQSMVELKSDLAILEDERKRAQIGIEPAILRPYESIRSRAGGIAVSRIERDACEICYRALPAQRIIEVRKLDSLVTCEGCGRILLWAE